MKTVVFLIWSPVHSIKRYLLVADQFSKLKIKTIFLDFEGKLENVIDEYISDLNINHKPHYESYSYDNKTNKSYNTLSKKIKTYISKIIVRLFNPKNKEFFNSKKKYSYPGELGKTLTDLKIDNSLLIKKNINKLQKNFNQKVNHATKFIKDYKPDCVFYDSEFVDQIMPFLHVANSNNIKIISMQHAIGNTYSYSELPLLADYYIAYSRFNSDVLKHMGVKEKNILLTGNPDMDIIHQLSTGEIKEELSKFYKIDFSKKIIVIPLKPNSYNDQNKILVNNLVKFFGKNEDYCILVKPHPADLINTNNSNNNVDFGSNNFHLIDSSYPIINLFKICTYSIFYFSSCIVESVLINIKAIVINDPFVLKDNGVKWPDWNLYKVFHSINIELLPSVLDSINTNQYKYEKFTNNEHRELFIKDFSSKYDSNSSLRIAKNVERILS